MSKGPFDWLEAPLPDTDLDAYVELNRAVDVDIIPAGNTVVGLENWRIGLERKAWSRLRFNAASAGGVTTAIKAMGLARASGGFSRNPVLCFRSGPTGQSPRDVGHVGVLLVRTSSPIRTVRLSGPQPAPSWMYMAVSGPLIGLDWGSTWTGMMSKPMPW